MKTAYGKLVALIVLIVVGTLLFAPMRFGGDDYLYPHPRSVRMNPGDSYALSYRLDAADPNQAVTYSSTNEAVAVVDETGAVGTLTTTGSLDLSRGGSVVFTGEVARLEPGVYTLVSAERLSFGGTWTCPLPMPSRTATLRRSGDDLILNVCARGTLVIFR